MCASCGDTGALSTWSHQHKRRVSSRGIILSSISTQTRGACHRCNLSVRLLKLYCDGDTTTFRPRQFTTDEYAICQQTLERDYLRKVNICIGPAKSRRTHVLDDCGVVQFGYNIFRFHTWLRLLWLIAGITISRWNSSRHRNEPS